MAEGATILAKFKNIVFTYDIRTCYAPSVLRALRSSLPHWALLTTAGIYGVHRDASYGLDRRQARLGPPVALRLPFSIETPFPFSANLARRHVSPWMSHPSLPSCSILFLPPQNCLWLHESSASSTDAVTCLTHPCPLSLVCSPVTLSLRSFLPLLHEHSLLARTYTSYELGTSKACEAGITASIFNGPR